MNFPDTVIVLRAVNPDAYGNEASDWLTPLEIPSPAFEVLEGTLLLLPADIDVREGDRFMLRQDVYTGKPQPIRSPSARKLYMIRLARVED